MADNKEKFDMIYTSMTHLSKEYVDDVMKTIAFLLLAIGWIVTSDRSRAFLSTENVNLTALIAIVFIALTHVLLSIGAFRTSQVKMRLLEDLDYVSREYYAGDRVTGLLLIANLALHLALFATLFALILTLQIGT